MTKEEIYVDFNGKRFYAPFKCLCCGVEVSVEQFCYGRTCAYCDCGKCQKGKGIGTLKFKVIYEEGHNREDIFNNAEDTPKQSQSSKKYGGEKMKLKKVNYRKIEGHSYAIEVYEDYSTKVVKFEKGVSDYILNGGKNPKLKILGAKILNENTPEFFSELMEKGVDAIPDGSEKTEVKE